MVVNEAPSLSNDKFLTLQFSALIDSKGVSVVVNVPVALIIDEAPAPIKLMLFVEQTAFDVFVKL